MKMYFDYLKKVLLHKYYVFIECCKLGIPWLGIIHDLSKFLPCEFFAYARYFNSRERTEKIKLDYDMAWLHHQKHNKHHWQHWILHYDDDIKWEIMEREDRPGTFFLYEYMSSGYDFDLIPCHKGAEYVLMLDLKNTPVCMRMPRKYVLEMVADWRGAGRAFGSDGYNDSDTVRWYTDREYRIILNNDTRREVNDLLGV